MAISSLRFERLESRELLSVSTMGDEFRVNDAIATNEQTTEATRRNASFDAAGDSVVVWQASQGNGAPAVIYARVFDAAGTPLTADLKVSSPNPGRQVDPAVAMDADGDFVVAWANHDDPGLNADIAARRFHRDGTAYGPEFLVTTDRSDFDRFPTVGVDDTGAFLIAWRASDHHDVESRVALRRFGSDGAPLGPELKFTASQGLQQFEPIVGVARDGIGVVVWPSSNTILGQRIDAMGNLLGSPIQLATTSNAYDLRQPAIAIGADDGFVVTWSDYQQNTRTLEVIGRRFDPQGQPLGGAFQVNTYTYGNQQESSIGIDDRGNFVVVWNSAQEGLPTTTIEAQCFLPDGTRDHGQFRVTIGSPVATVAMDRAGNFMVAWTAQDIMAQRYVYKPNTTVPSVVSVSPLGQSTSLTPNERIEWAVGGLTVQFSEAMDKSDSAKSVLNRNNWYLMRDDGYAAGAIQYLVGSDTGAVDLLFRHPLLAGSYTLVALEQIVSEAGQVSLDGNGDGIGGGEFRYPFTVEDVTRDGSESLVNSYQPGLQGDGDVAMDSDGNYVVAWASYQDGSARGIYAQRFDNQGHRLGTEFRVNTYRQGDQVTPVVAMKPDGEFLIAWSSWYQPGDDSQEGIVARRYDAQGNPLSDEFVVNAVVQASQTAPAAAYLPNGGFVVSWQNEGRQILARCFDPSGVPTTGDFRIDQLTQSQVDSPALAVDGRGDVIFVWPTFRPNRKWEIEGRRFSSSGQPLGGEFTVNSSPPGAQRDPKVAADEQGRFLVVWDGPLGDEPSSIFARRFGPDGAALGQEFRVTDRAASSQAAPDVAMSPSGEAVIVWEGYVEPGDASFAGVFAQRYGADGRTLGRQFPVNTTTYLNQRNAAVAMDALGDFVVVWDSQVQSYQSGNTNVYGQRFRHAMEPVPGDADGDRSVQLSDFGILKQQFGQSVRGASPLANADFNGDGVVDLTDFGILKMNFGRAGAIAAESVVGSLDRLLLEDRVHGSPHPTDWLEP